MRQKLAEVALCGTLTSLDDLLAALPVAPALLLVEQVGAGWLDRTGRDQLLRFERFVAGEPIDRRTRGRIFGELFEVRWEPGPDAETSLRVRYVGVPVELASLAPAGLELRLLEVRDVSDDLWGERVDEPALVGAPADAIVYAELRVPRLLRYPVDGRPRRIRLRVREYVDPTTGKMVLSRFIGLDGEG